MAWIAASRVRLAADEPPDVRRGLLVSGRQGVKGTGSLVGVEGAKPLARSVPAFPNEGGIPPE